ncbi:RNA 3'-terminal phosphate cyclase-like [Tubulanus polymorphus]|uniref:RNA 3'-terminal phosphate cyclase-like n=1 Tax=Tubulanus polymorphus TaxID=672921 RepID=UPI003DA5D08B
MASADGLIDLDGSVLEGGGQILRIGAAITALLQKPLRVQQIRAGRSNPGLRPQHLAGLELVTEICRGKLEGGYPKSLCIMLVPNKIRGGHYLADTQTAGSICLLMQISLPVMLFADQEVEIVYRGGTDADYAPSIDHFTMIFQSVAKHFGIEFDCKVRTRGYYPRGGGEVVLRTRPIRFLKPVNLTDPGTVVRITGRAFVAGVLPIKIAHTMAHVATEVIRAVYPKVAIEIQAVKEQNAIGNGTGIIIMAETSTRCRLAGSALGKKGVPAEKVGEEAADMLLNNLEHQGCVDEYLQDQLIIFMALAKGHSTLKCGALSLHTETAIHVAKTLTNAKFEVKEVAGISGSFTIECDGIGLENRSAR